MGLFDFLKRKNQGQKNEEQVKPEVPAQTNVAPKTPQPVTNVQQNPEPKGNHYIDDSIDGPEELFVFISKYGEYVVRFLAMMFQDVTAPISAYEKPNGELIGYLYIAGDDDSYTLTPTQVVERMEAEFTRRIQAQQITSWVILYHSEFKKDDNHRVAADLRDMSAINIKYHFDGQTKPVTSPFHTPGREMKLFLRDLAAFPDGKTMRSYQPNY